MKLLKPLNLKGAAKSLQKTAIKQAPAPVSYTHLDVYKRQR